MWGHADSSAGQAPGATRSGPPRRRQPEEIVTDLPERNKEAVRRFFQEIWNDGDESAIDRFIAEDAAGNDPKFGVGRESFRRQWRRWRAAFPDIRFELDELVAEGDTVVSRWTLTGTHTGPFLGAAPTGVRIRVAGMSLDHLRDGIVVSGFDAWDALGLRQQLGLVPPDPDDADAAEGPAPS
jgi:predicted ester cyclase